MGIFTDSFPTFSEYSPSDWTYGETVLKKRLGGNFFIYGMCVFELYIRLVNFEANITPTTYSSILLLRFNDLRNKMCRIGVGCTQKRTLLPRDEIGTHSFTIAHRFSIEKENFQTYKDKLFLCS